jgi:hypothetical protein
MEPTSIHRFCDEAIDKARDRATVAEDRADRTSAWAWTFGILLFISLGVLTYTLPVCAP